MERQGQDNCLKECWESPYHSEKSISGVKTMFLPSFPSTQPSMPTPSRGDRRSPHEEGQVKHSSLDSAVRGHFPEARVAWAV